MTMTAISRLGLVTAVLAVLAAALATTTARPRGAA